MKRIQTLEECVRQLYAEKDPKRADWADWLSENHIMVVADNAIRLARSFGANEELAQAAALLHDIADTRMSRFAENHEETSLAMARDLMEQVGFREDEISLTVDDAIRYHSCSDGHIPGSIEGKVLAAADSLAHLQTDFYLFGIWSMSKEKSLHDIKQWALKKIDRDFNAKIMFDKVKDECRDDYERLKVVFSR